MELLKKTIQASVAKTMKDMQITLDKDMNVPDTRPDMEKLVQNRGELRLEEIEVMNDRVRIRGSLLYRGLYLTGEPGPVLGSLSHPFEIEEYVNIDGIGPADTTRVTAELDDLNVVMINSRKLGIRALITFHVFVNEVKKVEGAVGTEEPVEKLCQSITLSQLAFHKRDTSRIKGEMTLAASKPNIRELVWDQVSLRNPEVRLMDGKVMIRGELLIFLLYLGEEEHAPVQYLEWELPFHSEVECPECEENMVGNIHLSLGSGQIDSDEIEIKAVISLDMIAFSVREGKVITSVEEQPCDYRKLKEIPGIAGYIAGPDDHLWNIAKRYGSTIGEIKRMNHLEDEKLKEGQKILIVKQVAEIL